MADIKFPSKQIEKFNDRIENCLEDAACRSVLEFYLKTVMGIANLNNILKLWNKANASFDDDIFDFIDEVDDFQDGPLLTLSESHLKVAYVKNECCRLFNKANIHQRFIQYLIDKHQQ
ncbi:hypothetical protein TcasGA2_TC001394 [Tribolium castaneum]|uniref:Uncharacterized protein n=1 Tax=Tribolium castaneum TaxID=7070 RepID=D7GXI2_TRICA|nr:PREDICTED: uncharacterized protein LOC103312673 [Tribolium castaneum]EFA13678.1 hypothetical protein TcasGA2_TC001394 [Tribolium castaneum]|eukprot:XP_008192185.1 PREDICTED: uncharacterized protein LOC103312673 [Tribolium castaneum]